MPDIPSSPPSGKLNQPYIMDIITLDRVYLQMIPEELMISAETQFKTIDTAGRNIPRYHYTGGEDTIEFTLHWWCENENRNDVISNCRWIEQLGRINSSKENVHPVKFVFGHMFSDSKFIIFSAHYKLGLFQRPHYMYPAMAEQTIVLRRVSDENPGWAEYYVKAETY